MRGKGSRGCTTQEAKKCFVAAHLTSRDYSLGVVGAEIRDFELEEFSGAEGRRKKKLRIAPVVIRSHERSVLLVLHKPYGVLSQFTPEPGSRWRTLAGFKLPAQVYALGRLDADSEGLLLFSDEAGLNSRLLDPEAAHRREYWAQVERIPTAAALAQLARGIKLSDYTTRPCGVRRLDPSPEVPPRDPPIRQRKNVPDCWLSLELIEGKNRQVRRMTAAIGHPTLRLRRVRIGQFKLGDLAPGHWRELTTAERVAVFL